jgi:hypothetical protein
LTNNLAFKALTFAALVPIWRPLPANAAGFQCGHAGSLLLAAPALVISFGMNFLLGAR